jgi:hypothetical protein
MIHVYSIGYSLLYASLKNAISFHCTQPVGLISIIALVLKLAACWPSMCERERVLWLAGEECEGEMVTFGSARQPNSVLSCPL